jgi:lipopolysaccharide export LptBFGC system permease protein LptF
MMVVCMRDWRKNIKLILPVAVCAAVVLAVLAVFVMRDMDAPEIGFGEAGMAYDASLDQSQLLSGVTAWDRQDGDVSSSLIVESITAISGTQVNVIYVARDSNNNIARVSRIMNVINGTYEYEQETEGSTMGEETSGQGSMAVTGTGYTTAATAYTTFATIATAQGAPEITLSSDNATIKAGTAFNVTSYISQIADDKDSRSELYRRVLIRGDYDTKTPGDYLIYIYCRDSDGNLSQLRPFTLHVQQ